MSVSHPPTIIVVHPKERKSKCSVQSLRTREDFIFWKYPRKEPDQLTHYVRLGMGGPQISQADAASGLLVLDGTWRLAEKMEAAFEELPVRSLPVWETAYPRVSKKNTDPAAGLATIEAIFIAYHLLGYETEGLLDDYYWAEEFLKKNRDQLS
ncbi:MAG: DTW domain-containing protein [Planctomycetaceae bacterium]|nr:DTW domain-containing protein [Planctomycetaceae bacterium]